MQQKQTELDVRRGQNDTARRSSSASSSDPQDAAARTTCSKSRLSRYKEIIEQKAEQALEAIELRIPPGPRLGTKVIHFATSEGSAGELLHDLSFEIQPGGALGVTARTASARRPR